MTQAVNIETQPEQQSLTLLDAQRAAWGAGREVALHRTEQTLDQCATTIDPSRELLPHLGAHSMAAPGFLSTLGGDHAVCPELLSDVGMIPLAVELGVGQHQADARLLGSRFDHSGQIRAICDNTNW